MKIGSQSQTLVSLHSLLDASKQQQIQRDEQQQQDKKTEGARDGRLAARKAEREELIQQNRDALRKVQDDLRLKNLQKLQQAENKEVNLNFRESFTPTAVADDQPAFEKLGQIVDIKI